MNLEYLRSRPVGEGDVAGPTPTSRSPAAGPFGPRPGRLIRMLRGSAKLLLPLVALAIGFAGFQHLKATKPETPKRPKQERTFNVTTVRVQPGDVRPRLTLFGTTTAGRQVEIRARVAGPVIETSPALVEGGLIGKGELILAIDPFDYQNALAESEAQLAETRARIKELEASIASETVSLGHARAQLALAIEDLERAEPLAKRGAVTERTVDERQQVVLQRRQAADQLANSIAVWEARVAQSRAAAQRLEAGIARARRRIEETRLEAPFNAYVAEVTTQVGRMIGANDKIATLIDRDWIEVRLVLTDAQFGRMVADGGSLIGRKVDVEWTLGGKTFPYTARIERIGARVASEAGGVEVLARVENPAEPVQLRPGAFVTATLDDVLYRGVVRLPGSSLYDRDTVYVVDDGRLAARKVKLVGAAGPDILVEGDLAAGETVLVTRISTPGTGVAVKEVAAP